jgi:hypothetical protein
MYVPAQLPSAFVQTGEKANIAQKKVLSRRDAHTQYLGL